MRIRKHASKILGTASSVFCLLPSSPPPSSPAPAAGLLQAYYFCELNRSPWDVLPFPPLPPRRLLDPPPNPKEEEEEAIVRNEIKEEPISVIESKQSFGSARAMRKDERDDEEHDNEKKKKKRRRRKSTDDVKKHKRRVKKDMRGEARSPGVVITCKKTDGKKWRCKRPAHHPNSFCHYHLTQLRSYSYTANNQRVPATAGNDDGDRSRRRRTVKDSGSFYYYSAFGPWRGKRRGRDSAETVAPAKAADEEGNKDEEQKEADDHENNVNEDVAVDDDDDDDDDSEEENERDEEKRNHKSNTRKKGRKPVKARSLKSLL